MIQAKTEIKEIKEIIDNIYRYIWRHKKYDSQYCVKSCDVPNTLGNIIEVTR